MSCRKKIPARDGSSSLETGRPSDLFPGVFQFLPGVFHFIAGCSSGLLRLVDCLITKFLGGASGLIDAFREFVFCIGHDSAPERDVDGEFQFVSTAHAGPTAASGWGGGWASF